MDELTIISESLKVKEELDHWYRIKDTRPLKQEEKDRIEELKRKVEELTTTKPRLHQIGMDEVLFRCAVCGEEWLFNPLMFMDDPDPEKRSIIYCPGPKPEHLIPIAWGFDEDGEPV